MQIRVHEEGEKEMDGEVQVEMEREIAEHQGGQHIMDGMRMERQTRERLEPMWCDT